MFVIPVMVYSYKRCMEVIVKLQEEAKEKRRLQKMQKAEKKKLETNYVQI